jgi:hypothetical protein
VASTRTLASRRSCRKASSRLNSGRPLQSHSRSEPPLLTPDMGNQMGAVANADKGDRAAVLTDLKQRSPPGRHDHSMQPTGCSGKKAGHSSCRRSARKRTPAHTREAKASLASPLRQTAAGPQASGDAVNIMGAFNGDVYAPSYPKNAAT